MRFRRTATLKWMNCGCLNHNNEIKGGPRVPAGVPVVMAPVRRLRAGVQRRPALLQHQLRRPPPRHPPVRMLASRHTNIRPAQRTWTRSPALTAQAGSPSCSCTGCGCWTFSAAGTTGSRSSSRRATARPLLAGPTVRPPSSLAGKIPACSPARASATSPPTSSGISSLRRPRLEDGPVLVADRHRRPRDPPGRAAVHVPARPAHITGINAGRLSLISHPAAVTRVIIAAAQAAS